MEAEKHPLPPAERRPLLPAQMTFTIRPSDYYYANVRDELGAAYRVLSQLAERGVNLLAFTAVPAGPSLAQFALFPTEPAKLVAEAKAVGLVLDGPHHALVVQGDDELGAFASVHERLLKVGVDIYAAAGVIDGRGSFGYVLYVREDQFERAAEALRLQVLGPAARNKVGVPTGKGKPTLEGQSMEASAVLFTPEEFERARRYVAAAAQLGR